MAKSLCILACARMFLPFAVLAVWSCREPQVVTPGGGTPTGFAQSYGLWTPGPRDDCSAEAHNAYSVVGPDGKLYPTWHPPVDPATGCSFGHDHGRDPRGSALFAQVGPIPFGYANEQLDAYDPANPRHEDHFGHKVEWENDVPLHFGSAAADQLFEIRCDVLTKLHQGTHSRDAFTNNMHELRITSAVPTGPSCTSPSSQRSGTPAGSRAPATAWSCSSGRRRPRTHPAAAASG